MAQPIKTVHIKTNVHPASNHDDLDTGSGVMRWTNSCRRHAAQGSDASAEGAQILYHLILRSTNLPEGTNRRIAAMRIRRAIMHASSLEMEAAKAWATVSHLLRANFGDPGSKLSQKGFDPSK